MTTIAFKNGQMAGDSFVHKDGTYFVQADKIIESRNWVIGCAGDHGACLEVVTELEAKSASNLTRNQMIISLKNLDLKGQECEFLAYNKGVRDLYYFCHHFSPIPLSIKQFYAIGSGQDLAMGAMAHGASAYEAVDIACKLDRNSWAPVFVVTCI
jgi:hypothetical protein